MYYKIGITQAGFVNINLHQTCSDILVEETAMRKHIEQGGAI